MKKPRPPTIPIEPKKPDRTFFRKTYHRVELGDTLQDMLNQLPQEISAFDVKLEDEGSYDDYHQFYQYATTESVVMSDAQWVKALQRYDVAFSRYQEKLVEYGEKLALHKESIQSIEAQERALLASLQSKYPSP